MCRAILRLQPEALFAFRPVKGRREEERIPESAFDYSGAINGTSRRGLMTFFPVLRRLGIFLKRRLLLSALEHLSLLFLNGRNFLSTLQKEPQLSASARARSVVFARCVKIRGNTQRGAFTGA